MLTIAEAAARLGLSPSTLRVQIRNGKLRSTMKGPIRLVSEREVERYRAESLGKRRSRTAHYPVIAEGGRRCDFLIDADTRCNLLDYEHDAFSFLDEG